MTVPRRFALSTLLLVMLFVSLVFGYAQWRKQWLFVEAKELKASGAESFQLTDSWFWPNVSSSAVILFKEGNDGTYFVADKALNPVDAKCHYDSVRARLQAIGVEDVSCGMVRVVRNNEVIVETVDFNEPGK